MSFEREIIDGLFESGRLVAEGALRLDDEIIYKPPVDKKQPDKNGFYPPETPYGGHQNKFVNEVRNEWLSSSDQFKVAAAKNVPHLFAVFSEHYNPERGTPEWMLLWRNSQRWWVARGENRLVAFEEAGYKPIKDHLFVSLQNATYLDHPEHDKLMGNIVAYYRFKLEQQYSIEKWGSLEDR